MRSQHRICLSETVRDSQRAGHRPQTPGAGELVQARHCVCDGKNQLASRLDAAGATFRRHRPGRPPRREVSSGLPMKSDLRSGSTQRMLSSYVKAATEAEVHVKNTE